MTPSRKEWWSEPTGIWRRRFFLGAASPHPRTSMINSRLWLPTANSRRVRVLDGRPVDFLDADRAQMLSLPPVPPTVETVTSVRLGRDYYVRVAGNDYS